jgi:hypothetical protein
VKPYINTYIHISQHLNNLTNTRPPRRQSYGHDGVLLGGEVLEDLWDHLEVVPPALLQQVAPQRVGAHSIHVPVPLVFRLEQTLSCMCYK